MRAVAITEAGCYRRHDLAERSFAATNASGASFCRYDLAYTSSAAPDCHSGEGVLSKTMPDGTVLLDPADLESAIKLRLQRIEHLY